MAFDSIGCFHISDIVSRRSRKKMFSDYDHARPWYQFAIDEFTAIPPLFEHLADGPQHLRSVLCVVAKSHFHQQFGNAEMEIAMSVLPNAVLKSAPRFAGLCLFIFC
jgi:hypothetical protein